MTRVKAPPQVQLHMELLKIQRESGVETKAQVVIDRDHAAAVSPTIRDQCQCPNVPMSMSQCANVNVRERNIGKNIIDRELRPIEGWLLLITRFSL